MSENDSARKVMDAAFHIHRELGPGLLEVVYEVVLAKKLADMGYAVERQVPVSIRFEGIAFDEGFRADLVVENKVIIELKSVERLRACPRKAAFDLSASDGLPPWTIDQLWGESAQEWFQACGKRSE